MSDADARQAIPVGGAIEADTTDIDDVDDLPTVQTCLVLAVRLVGPIPQADLVHEGISSKGAASKNLQELVADGYIRRRERPGYANAYIVYDPRRNPPTQPPTADLGLLAGCADHRSTRRAILLAVRLAGPIMQRDLTAYGVVSQGCVSPSVRDLVADGWLDRRPIASPNGGYVVWDPERQTEPERRLRADGGLIECCPECGRGGGVRHRKHNGKGRPAIGEETYRCKHCRALFDEPDERPAEPGGGRAKYGHLTTDDCELLTDGGHVETDEEVPDPGTWTGPPTSRAHVTITERQSEQLDTLVDIGIYTSRSEAIRSAVRREIRFQADDPDDVAEQLQRLYDYAMAGRRPETIGSAERLAELLGVQLTREGSR